MLETISAILPYINSPVLIIGVLIVWRIDRRLIRMEEMLNFHEKRLIKIEKLENWRARST